MPVSRNRKGQKKKAIQRSEQIKAAQRKLKQRMLEEYLESQRLMAEKTQVVGEVVEDSDIDLGVDIEMSDDEFEIQDDFSIDEDDVTSHSVDLEYAESIEQEFFNPIEEVEKNTKVK